jgi:hypothetical protein
VLRKRGRALVMALATPCLVWSGPEDHPASELVGTWRGTSVCTDRVAAPACKDEVIVYEFSAGTSAGTVRWQADKVVNGERQSMGDPLDMAYDRGDGCWRTEFKSPRVHIVWCLRPNGAKLDGSAWLLPGKETVRKVEAKKE